MNAIKIIIDKEVVDKYHEYYFRKYPKRKVLPIKSVFPPSLNRFISMKRMAQNDCKQKYKEFSIWLASNENIANLNLDKVIFNYTFFFSDHRRRDFDNLVLTPKFVNDGFVDAKVIIDDCGEKLKIEFENFEYDKNNPRIEIIIKERN